MLQSGNFISVYGGTAAAPRRVTGFRFASNIVLHNTYGIFGNGVGTGNAAIATYFPQSVIVGNVIAGGPSQSLSAGQHLPERRRPDGAVPRRPDRGLSASPREPAASLPQGEAGADVR